MINPPEVFIGIDPTGSRTPYTWAMVDVNCTLVELNGGDLEDVLNITAESKAAILAINAPFCPNQGIVRKTLSQENSTSQMRKVDLRLAEYLLRQRGIAVPPTPFRHEVSPTWVQMGFDLHHALNKMGFQIFPVENATHQYLETNPHAIFCSLLGHLPLPKPTLEGRLQRQLLLHDRGEGITDPMDFFEEITRHKLLCGSLPMDTIYTSEELDSLAAAFTAWSVINSPEDVIFIGDPSEGQIVLPVRELLAQYV